MGKGVNKKISHTPITFLVINTLNCVIRFFSLHSVFTAVTLYTDTQIASKGPWRAMSRSKM